MKPDEIRRVVLEELSNIAPETDPAGIDPEPTCAKRWTSTPWIS